MIEKLKTKDYKNFLSFCSERNVLKDIKIRKMIFNNCLKRDDLCIVKKENEEIKSIIIVYKKNNQRYLKLFSSSFKDTKNLLQVLKWENISDLTLIANKKDRNLVWIDRETKKLIPSYPLQTLGFKIKEDSGNKLIFTNKE